MTVMTILLNKIQKPLMVSLSNHMSARILRQAQDERIYFQALFFGIICLALCTVTAQATLISRDRLASHVDEQARNILSACGHSESQIPSTYRWDFSDCKTAARHDLEALLSKRNRLFVGDSEVKQITAARLSELIAKLTAYAIDSTPQPTYNTQSSQSLTDTLWSIFGSSTPSQTTSQSSSQQTYSTNAQTSPTHVYAHQIESHVLSTARDALRSNGIDADNIPARAVSDYSEHIQKSISRVKTFANAAWDKSVAKSQVETIVREELKPVIDTILFRSEQCAICQDGYTSGQRVGYLDCGHLFHDDCINTSLKYKKQCPLCRKNVSFVAKKETIR